MPGNERFGDRPTTISSATLDSIGSALPVELAAQHVDSNVVSALARWRDIDQFSLQALAPALWTNNGEFIGNSPGYLLALHGFVAEKVVDSDLAGSHDIVLPDQTNVPAYDMIVDGTPVQVKEGTSAYQAVQHALQRYPGVTSFVTDPSTAAHLRQHGIDAVGVAGLYPAEISRTTNQSVEGLYGLEEAGRLHVPILTTVSSLCKYWDRYDAEQIDATEAIKFAAVDIGAQTIGAAAGMKAAAAYVVATGAFGLAALPLTIGTIVGAIGLRHIVNQNRAQGLRESLRQFEDTRKASEMAAEIVVEQSRRFVLGLFQRADAAKRRENGTRATQWAVMRDETCLKVCSASVNACRALIASAPQNDGGSPAFAARLSEAFAETDPSRRYLSIESCLTDILSAFPAVPPSARSILTEWIEYARAEFRALIQRRALLEAEARSAVSELERKIRLDLVCEYALLLVRLTRVAKPTVDAINRVTTESTKLGGERNERE